MKEEMSSFDIMAAVAELPAEMRVKKVFQPTPSQLRIQLRTREGSTRNLIIEAGRRLYLSEHLLQAPRRPSNFAMTLRKHIANGVVREVRQISFDRIVEMRLENRGEEYRLVFELFGEGNILLLNKEGRIIAVMRPRRFRHRDLVARELYTPPPAREDPFNLTAERLKELASSYKSVVKALAVPLGLGGLYAEEVCSRAGVSKGSPAPSVEEAERIKGVLKSLREEALEPGGLIIYQNSTPVDVVPVRLKLYTGMRSKEFQSFHQALDEFFTSLAMDEAARRGEETFEAGLRKLCRKLREQARAMKGFRAEAESSRRAGDAIYASLEKVQRLLQSLLKARKELSPQELEERLSKIPWVKRYEPGENTIVVDLGGTEVKLDLRSSASANAERFYNRAKRARAKLLGAKKAAEKTKEEIREYLKKGSAPIQELMPRRREPEERKRWFENYRWFTSSEGFLVVGGKDASSNERIVKRHMESRDIFVHAEIHGAPAVIVKAQGKPVPEPTIEEACQFAASYSSAWKSGAAYLNVYWVHPSQVSKTPPTGEYVQKGAFIIRGRKNRRRVKLQLAIGIVCNDRPKVICGPPKAVEKLCIHRVQIVPGHLKSRKASQEILQLLLEKASAEERKAIKTVRTEDVQRLLPAGGCEIMEAT